MLKILQKTKKHYKNATDALSDYMKIGLMWTFGLSIMFYARYDKIGATMSIIINLLIIAWIYFSYMNAFEIATKNNNLKPPIISILW